ncbi:YvqK [Paenibacillus mucilaginosus 3016]|uniref:Corrinoid adenosyltransferase n=2 Tax=Paenibacillus mucilaginosus TaxID=61624 RepID=H6NGF7_9BACL|nr:cob(I)yrinic acid a,c-diamide adenosyltransferase [Paenibacillus mucilaginosus]AFC33039.1 YvqK [Paenibacillus mucilaginosus 3016]AFH65353.1 ATP:cob(I)alamin adenosyltransferase [Paenibacillus mucilaginosus K02]WFA21477.1 cob(I)yrinic acid a,c-diamide adenosyltransferase [Paenibacillus mucilaginosus]
MRIYTRTGDAGQTGVIGGRVDKDDVRVEAYGTTDELNCFVGQAIGFLDPQRDADLAADLLEIQHEIFDCGSDLALLKQELRPYKVTAEMVDRLEAWIDKYDAETPDIKRFILPGGSLASSTLHVCRTVCRRAERRVVTLARTQPINDEVRRYLNRLSDFFFTVARVANHRAGMPDVEYVRSAEVFRRKS